MGFFDKIMNLDRRWLYLLVGVSAIIPLIVPLNLPVRVSPPVQKLFDHMETLQPGEVVMVSFDYGPSTAPENDPMADAVIRHALEKDARVVCLALYPIGGVNEGLEELERCVGPLDGLLPSAVPLESEHFRGKFYGRDYIYLGYKDGGLAAMRQMNDNIHTTFPTDYWGTPLDKLPLGRDVQGYADLNFVFSVATGIIGEWWANLVNAQFHVPVAVGCTAVSAPKYFAYYRAEQMFALLGGLKGAAEYEKLLREGYPRLGELTSAEIYCAAKGSDVQSVVYSLITIFIILGNIAFFVERSRQKIRH